MRRRFLKAARKATCSLVVPEPHAYVSGEQCRVCVDGGPGEAMLLGMSANGSYITEGRFDLLNAGVADHRASTTLESEVLQPPF